MGHAESLYCTTVFLFQDFGEEEVALLVDHFRPVLLHAGLSADDVELEWDMLKETVYSK